MNKRHLFILAVLASLGVFWAACSPSKPPFACQDKIGCVDLGPGEPLKLGVIQALTGKVAALGQEQVRGLELALARRGGKIAGREVALFTEDTACKPEGGANAALKIVSDPKIVAIFGTTCSSDAATAALVMTEAGLVMISGNNSAMFLTSMGGQRAPKWQAGYFRTAPNEEFSGPAAAKYAFEKLDVRVAATINDGDLYTRGLTDGFKAEFERLGGKVALSATVNKNDADMEPVLSAAVNSGAGLIFFPLFQPEGNHLLLQARETPALEKTILMSDGSLIENSFIQAVGNKSLGMYFVGPTPPPASPAMELLASEYTVRYHMDPPTTYYVSAFDAANILASALEKAAVREENGALHIGRQALRDALYQTTRYEGVSGVLSCDEFGDCAPPRFDVLRMEDPAAGVEGLKKNVVFTYAPDK